MHALQVHLMSRKVQVNKTPSFMTFRRKFTLKMLTVSNIASYAFGYCTLLLTLFQFVSIWSISTQNEINAVLLLYFITSSEFNAYQM